MTLSMIMMIRSIMSTPFGLVLLLLPLLPLSDAYRFALLPKSIDNPFFLPAGLGCQQAANATSSTCDVLGPEEAEQLPEVQVDIITSIIKDKTYDGIAISPIDIEIVQPVIDQAVEAGIPVVTFDTDAPESKRSAYIGTDNRFFGEQLAKVLIQLQPKGGTFATLAKDNSPILEPNIFERINAFIETLEQHGKWTQLPNSPASFGSNFSLAIDQMKDFAKKQPTAIVPVQGAPMRSGRWEEFAQFIGPTSNHTITVVSGDAMPNQLEYLATNMVDGLVGQLPAEMGSYAIQALYDILEGRQVEEVIGTNVLIHLKVPLVLPEAYVDGNQIGNLSWVGYILFGIIAATCIACTIWVVLKRKVKIVSAAQPFFLHMINAGVVILAATMIPLSFDDGGNFFDDETGALVLDQGPSNNEVAMCMSIPWLASIGFTTTFSALLSKTIRIERIFRSKKQHSRVVVRERDVMLPFLILLVANLIILICWTAIDPLTYVRIAGSGTDEWNRIISTYGACRSNNSLPYLIPLVIVNVIVLILANWMAYQTRFVKSEFSESKFIALAMFSMLQTLLLGIPVLFTALQNPSAFYLILVFMIFIVCMVTMILIFGPKVSYALNVADLPEHEQHRLMRSAISRSSFHHPAARARRQSEGNLESTPNYNSENSWYVSDADSRVLGPSQSRTDNNEESTMSVNSRIESRNSDGDGSSDSNINVMRLSDVSEHSQESKNSRGSMTRDSSASVKFDLPSCCVHESEIEAS